MVKTKDVCCCSCGKPATKTRKITNAGVDEKGKLVLIPRTLPLCGFCAQCHDENEMEARHS